MTSSLPLRALINSFSFYPLQLKKEKGSIYPSQQRAVYPRERSIYLKGKSYSSGQKKKSPHEAIANILASKRRKKTSTLPGKSTLLVNFPTQDSKWSKRAKNRN